MVVSTRSSIGPLSRLQHVGAKSRGSTWVYNFEWQFYSRRDILSPMKLDQHELDNEVKRVTEELEASRELVSKLEAKLDWLLRGQELYGGARQDGQTGAPLRKPTLTQAIVSVVGEASDDGWTPVRVMDQLRARGWMPNGSSAEHVVRARLAALARGDAPLLRRVSHGVYELNRSI